MLPKENRLNLAKEFRFLKRSASSISTPYFTILFRPTSLEHAQAGFVVSNKIGTATKRNHLKRQLRDLVHQNLDKLPKGLQIILIAKVVTEVPSYEKISLEFNKVLPKLSSHPSS